MNEAKLAWRVGIVVVCAVVILAILILLLGEGWQRQYTVFLESPTAPNVTRNTPVRKNGILIGRVSEVTNLDRNVRLTLRINASEVIYENELCRIGNATFLGDAVLDFVPGMQADRGAPVPDRATFRNVAITRNPVELLDMVMDLEVRVKDTLDSFRKASDNVAAAGENVAELTQTIQDAVGPGDGDFRTFIERAKNLSTKAETAIDNFNTLMVNVNEIAGDPESRQSIRESFQRLPGMLDEFNTTVVETRETINSFRKVGSSAEENLANLTDFTRSLGKDGPAIIESLNRSLEQVEKLVNDVGTLTKGLGNNNGTIGKLLNDPELYNNLNETIYNIRKVSVQLEPLMNDIRFTVDGIARDPGQVGLRGAFNRSPAFSGFKGNPGEYVPVLSSEPIENGW
jgi:phospholipid/cholesterol/gamma-HCH transport system substrate-binding protein